jgi:hypothetical protein
MASVLSDLHRSAFRFSPWWICAVASLILAVVNAVAWVSAAFTGPVLLAIFAAFVVSAVVVAAAGVPFLGRLIPSLVGVPHAKLTFFGALSAMWVSAWLLAIVAFGVVSALYGLILQADPAFSADSTTGGFVLDPSYWALSAPVLVLYVVLSAIAAALFGRGHSAP